MTNGHEGMHDHERFRELSAYSISGTLTATEWSELKDHLRWCLGCREVYNQYVILVSEGVPALGARYGNQEQQGSWDDRATRKKFFSRIRANGQQASSERHAPLRVAVQPSLPERILANPHPLARAALAACLVAAVGLIAYRLGTRAKSRTTQARVSTQDPLPKSAGREKDSSDKLVASQAREILRLQKQRSHWEKELAKLRLAMAALEDQTGELATSKTTADEQLQRVSQQRNALSGQLRDAELAYQQAQSELVNLRSERDKTNARNTSLESRIDELSAASRDLERRLGDDEQYLASDRDVRELMGARKLYIADVFDVDSGSRTRKPFGRVFYTQGKSLIFYAFDLDGQRGLKNANTFQAWGRRETSEGKPLNLGIFYMDNISNRRWVLRFDDPEQLAEIDAVFVTVEPQGGSRKPTGKPFLYALLRKEANHP